MKIPKSISLANLPTKIEKLERLSKSLGEVNIYIKRDDHTGVEITGNKVRKLEYAIQEALEQDCDYLITCGGIQSNHARATAAAAAKLGLGCYLVLRGSIEDNLQGNYLLDKILGAKTKLITPEEYSDSRADIMEGIKEELAKEGIKAYVIPEGASNGIGTFGYYKAMEEVFQQQVDMGVKFDAIVCAVGSGGTYAGLLLANLVQGKPTQIYGINVCDDAEHFRIVVDKLLQSSFRYTDEKVDYTEEDINIIDGYVGNGYAKSRPEELQFISELAKLEGVILDPVYTGKAMYGLVEEIKNGSFSHCKNILFIHTGGIFGLFPSAELKELV